MKERPIPFSAPMVRAILAGKKTQTRRIVKPQPESFVTKFSVNEHGIGISADEAQNHVWKCPYGVAGDRLWVREAFLPCKQGQPVEISDATYVCFRDGSQAFKSGGYYHQERAPNESAWPADAKWRPSIHMPRWASRITLEVVAVRVERLQEINGADLAAEGFPPDDQGPMRDGCRLTLEGRRQVFAGLWESINGPESWNANPWVWVVEFRKLEGGA